MADATDNAPPSAGASSKEMAGARRNKQKPEEEKQKKISDLPPEVLREIEEFRAVGDREELEKKGNGKSQGSKAGAVAVVDPKLASFSPTDLPAIPGNGPATGLS